MRHTTPSSETLIDILDQWAEREGLSDEQLAAALGYSGPAIRHWRQHRSVPCAKKWHIIAQHCGRTVEEVACAIARGITPVPRRRSRAISTRPIVGR